MSDDGPRSRERRESFVHRRRQEILADWQHRVRTLPAARALSTAVLIDHVPSLLEEIEQAAMQGEGELPTAQLHAIARLVEGFDVAATVEELSLLRACVWAAWEREPLDRAADGAMDELRAIDLAIDRAIRGTVARHAGEKARALEQIAVERERALAKLEALLGASPVGIAFLDRELRYLRINDALATLNGRPAAEHIGHTVHEMLPEAAAFLAPLLGGVLDTGVPVLNFELAQPGVTVGGTRYLLASFFPVRGATNVINGVGAFVTEITDRKLMEEDLRIAVRTREDMMAVVGHDLRGPLGAVQLSATLLLGHLSGDQRGRRHVETIQRACMRMENLIDDLLDTTSIRAGRFQIETRSELAEEVVDEATELQRPLAEERGINLANAFAVGGVYVSCDRDRILQVFGNLIGNALKFGRAGDTITIAGERDGEHMRFSVRDTGPGIEPNLLPHLFDPYWSAPEHARAGSGLGLYIVRGIIERHGGRVWVDSEPGDGATFWFTLPIERAE